jgi:hypothetical protein
MGRAEGDEQPFPGDARFSVMDVEAPDPFPVPADPARVAVVLEDMAAPSAEEENIPAPGGVTAGQKPRASVAEAPQHRHHKANWPSGAAGWAYRVSGGKNVAATGST